jgi:hypothetical protein
VFELVDRHFAVRTALAAANEQLEQREAQFRSVQKRLLVRYKVRPLGTYVHMSPAEHDSG